MKINRPISTENSRPLLLALVIMTALSLTPMLSYGAVYWDDEMEVFNGSGQGSSRAPTGGFNPLPANDPDGNPPMQVQADTAAKFSGSGSLRYNYTSRCQVTDGSLGVQPCGGSSSRSFPNASAHYGRVYLRVSEDFQWGASNGQTKIFGVRSTTGLSKLWFNFFFGLGMIVSAENTPNNGATTNIPINMTMPREQWVCIEWYIAANTPGQPNGLLQTWKNGVMTTNRSDIQWRGSTNTSYLDFIHIYRQSGFGNLWFDRLAVGNTRIGCIGATPASDTTRPAPPRDLVIR